MAETFDKLQEILQRIKNLERNFKKQALLLRTSRYINNEIRRLQEQYIIYKNLRADKSESELIATACLNIEAIHRGYSELLDRQIPSDIHQKARRSHSTEELNSLAVPENVDIVVGKLYVAQKTLDELYLNVHEVTDRLIEDFNINFADESEEYQEGIIRLERVVEIATKNKRLLEEEYSNERSKLLSNLEVKEKRIDDLESIILEADKSDTVADIIKSSSEKIRLLEDSNININNKNSELKQHLADQDDLIGNFSSKVRSLEQEKKEIQEKFQELENRVSADLSESGRKNYISLIHTISEKLEQSTKENNQLKSALEEQTIQTELKQDQEYRRFQENLDQLTLENNRLRERLADNLNNMDPKIVKAIRDTIPGFSGGRSNTLASDVRHFLSCCEMVYSKLNADDKVQFIEILKIKFSGDAADLMNISTYATLNELSDILYRAYVPEKDFQACTEELKRTIQRPGERLKEFGLRVSKLLQTCISEAKKEYRDNNGALLKSIEKDAIKAYRSGLFNNAIKYHLMTLDEDVFSKILEVAERLDKRTDLNSENLASLTTNTAPVENSSENTQASENNYKPRNYGNNGQNRRYNNNDSRQNNFGNNNRGQNNNAYGNVPPTNSYENGGQNGQERKCYGCGNPGHIKAQCQNPNGQNNNRQVTQGSCFRCGQQGHFQSQCRIRPENVFCTKCQRYGHIARSCRPRNTVAVAEAGFFCLFCQRVDHLIENCLYKREYESRCGVQMAAGNAQRDANGTGAAQ